MISILVTILIVALIIGLIVYVANMLLPAPLNNIVVVCAVVIGAIIIIMALVGMLPTGGHGVMLR